MLKEISGPDNKITLIVLLIGWLLGLLSTLLISITNRLIKKKEVKKGINVELNELQIRLVGICLISTIENIKIDDEWIKWMRPYYSKLIEYDAYSYLFDNLPTEFKPTITKMEYEKFSNILKNWNKSSLNNKKRMYPDFNEISLPFLEANYIYISMFNNKYKLKLSIIKREIIRLNAIFTDIKNYHMRTFGDLTHENREIILNNISNAQNHIAKRTKAIIKLIDEINTI